MYPKLLTKYKLRFSSKIFKADNSILNQEMVSYNHREFRLIDKKYRYYINKLL